MYPMVHQGKLVVLRGTPSKLVVTMVQQLVLKKTVPSRSKKKEGVKVVTANLPESFVNANVVCLL